MRKIWLVPFGGLGNRIRVMNSAMAMSKVVESELYLVWLIKAELNISLSGLFKSTGFDFNLVNGWKYRLFLTFYKHVFVVKYEKLYRAVSYLFFDTVIFDSDVLSLQPDVLREKISKGKKALIATCYDFYPFDDFNNYELNPELLSRVNVLSKDFDENTVGIHIRRTDHTIVMHESPVEKYFEEMDKLVQSNPQTRFFLATDDAEVKQNAKEKYTGRVITQEVPLTRGSEEGMLGAVIDIYCLSRTRKIICNMGSSFVKTAALIGKTKEIIEIRA